MSIQITQYLGIGMELDYDKNIGKIDSFLDQHPEYSEYSFLNPNADKPGLQIITDGMNGSYIYLMYVLNKVEQDDLYSGGSNFSMNVFDPVANNAINAVWELYKDIFGECYDDGAPSLISFFHCS